jgi:hypothetical protein
VALVNFSIVIVEQCGFTVANVQVSRWFRRESGDDFAFNGVLQDAMVSGVLLFQIECWRKNLALDKIFGLHFINFYIFLILPFFINSPKSISFTSLIISSFESINKVLNNKNTRLRIIKNQFV